jgi:trehalose 6-phosphate synthase
LVVANRLPVQRVRRGGGTGWATSPGGLVSALTKLVSASGGTWVGWTGTPGAAPKPFRHEDILNVPMALSSADVTGYYEGFANSTLWPLYHDCLRPPRYHRDWWRSYVDVNRRFAEKTAQVAPPGATVWVQDYHLQLVPALLRKLRADLRIGFFFHIPFPPQELFAQMPWRRSILEGLLGADLVGFQTVLGARNFGALARRFTMARGPAGHLNFDDRTIRYGAFPISIDFQQFDTLARADEIKERAAVLRARLGGRRILLGVDRLDYTKGIEQRLKAFRELLASGAVDPTDCVLVQTAVPSRERVVAYKEQKSLVERLVGEINGAFATIGQAVVHYVHKSFAIDDLVALYVAADVMLVTPLRDGMNLVAKEYVASHPDERGALVLSEFTGAAHELRGALIVNPYDIDNLIARLREALALSPAEQRRRMRMLRNTVRDHDVYRWADSFLAALAAG